MSTGVRATARRCHFAAAGHALPSDCVTYPRYARTTWRSARRSHRPLREAATSRQRWRAADGECMGGNTGLLSIPDVQSTKPDSRSCRTPVGISPVRRCVKRRSIIAWRAAVGVGHGCIKTDRGIVTPNRNSLATASIVRSVRRLAPEAVFTIRSRRQTAAATATALRDPSRPWSEQRWQDSNSLGALSAAATPGYDHNAN